MSDNRMFLVHEPSGLGVLLGKRDAIEYTATDSGGLGRLYSYIASNYPESYDSFTLLLEDGDRSDEWDYGCVTDEGFRRFIFKGAV